MEKLYYKHQWFYILVALAFFLPSLFFYFENTNLEDNAIRENHQITKKGCSASPRINSSIQIRKNGKTYTISLSEDECVKHIVGKQISLLYNKEYDYFIYPGKKDLYTSRAVFSGVILLFLLLPWSYISKNYFNLKSNH